MPVPRCIVLTDQPAGQHVTRYLTDRDRFPADELFTTDLGKARTWGYPPGVRRWIKRNLAVLPLLKECRRLWVNEDVVNTARKSAGAPPAGAPGSIGKGSRLKLASAGKPGRGRGKLNPNKRPPRSARKGRKPATAKRSTPRTARKAPRAAKAA